MATKKWYEYRFFYEAPAYKEPHPNLEVCSAWVSGYNAAIEAYKAELDEALKREQPVVSVHVCNPDETVSWP